MKREIPIVVLSGFLGSGKTTLLRRWRREEGMREAVVMVHDLGESGVDAELVAGEGEAPRAGVLTGRVAALHGSHARGRLHESSGRILEEIAALEPAPPVVLVESTGAARPGPLIAALRQDGRFVLRHFIVTVDALHLHRDFEDGRVLAGGGPAPGDEALARAGEVLAEQIAFANVVVLTKTDTVPAEVVEGQVRTMRRLQPRAAIGLSARAGLLLSQLEGVPGRGEVWRMGGGEGAEEATMAGVDCLVFRERRPFHPQRLHDVCRRHLATGLYRTKGFLWLASRPGDVLLWQQAGSRISLELTGFWRAEIANNRDGKFLPEEVAQLRVLLGKEDPVFGDRHVELTLIGLPAARETFAAALRRALCTDEEVAAWERGEAFPDPWPRSLVRVE